MPKLHEKNYKGVLGVPLMFYEHSFFSPYQKSKAVKENLQEYYSKGSENQIQKFRK